MTLAYRIELSPDDNDTLLVTCPALPEVTTFADDEADAIVKACEAIEEALAARISAGEEIPASDGDGVAIPLLSELKVELYRACRDRGLKRAELQRLLGWQRESVDRLFRLDHASKVGQLEEAYHALGFHLRLSIAPASEAGARA